VVVLRVRRSRRPALQCRQGCQRTGAVPSKGPETNDRSSNTRCSSQKPASRCRIRGTVGSWEPVFGSRMRCAVVAATRFAHLSIRLRKWRGSWKGRGSSSRVDDVRQRGQLMFLW